MKLKKVAEFFDFELLPRIDLFNLVKELQEGNVLYFEVKEECLLTGNTNRFSKVEYRLDVSNGGNELTLFYTPEAYGAWHRTIFVTLLNGKSYTLGRLFKERHIESERVTTEMKKGISFFPKYNLISKIMGVAVLELMVKEYYGEYKEEVVEVKPSLYLIRGGKK
jgi:hypothetical protein